MSKRTHIGDFPGAVVQRYLNGHAHEARGMTLEQYVQLCRDVWDKTKYDPEYERKVLIDFSQPVTLGQLVGADHLTPDFADSALLAAPVEGGFEGKHDIECLVLLTARVPTPGSASILQSRVAETFAPAQILLKHPRRCWTSTFSHSSTSSGSQLSYRESAPKRFSACTRT